jgi:hypothetical protein
VGDEVELDLVLRRADAALAGRVVDVRGQPIPGARVRAGQALPTSGEANVPMALPWPKGAVARPPLFTLTTDERGGFRIDDVPKDWLPVPAEVSAMEFAEWRGALVLSDVGEPTAAPARGSRDGWWEREGSHWQASRCSCCHRPASGCSGTRRARTAGSGPRGCRPARIG